VVASGLRLPLYLDSIGTILVGVLAGPIAGAATGLLSNLTWTFVLGGTALGSPYAWPFAIVAAEIGLLAGLFGYAGVFRPRPNTPLPTLAAGVGVAAVVLGAVAVWGILPFYRDLCAQLEPAGPGGGLCFQLFAPATDAGAIYQALGAGVLALLAVVLLGLVVRLVGGRDLGVVIALVAGALCGVVSALIATPIAALVFGGVTGSGTDFLVALFQQAGSDLQAAVLQQSLISDPIDKAIAYVVVFLALGGVSRRLVARFPQGERALGTVEA
jgi:energy-coupling factor transport system substrate-specific component